MATKVVPLPFTGDLIDYLNINGREITWLWRDGEAFIPVRPICDILGLDWKSQHRKLTSPESRSRVVMMTTQDTIGRAQEMLCIAYPDFMMWLAGITPSRVKEEARAPLNRLVDEIKTIIAGFYAGRLFGEVEEQKLIWQRFQMDFIAQKPIRFRVAQAVLNGWTFDMLAGSCSYTKKRLIDTIAEMIRVGAISEPLAGTPFSATESDPRQLDMFGGR